MPLHVACLHQKENIVKYVLQKCIEATQVHDRNGKILSIWFVIGMNICQHLLCIASWIVSRMHFAQKQTTTRFHSTTMFKTILPATTNSSS